MSGTSLIGALRVMLGLETAAFEEGLTRSQARLRAFDAKMKTFGAGMAKVGAALSVAGAGLAVAVRQQINAADAMEEMSQKFGVPVEELSRLGYAAEMNGVPIDLLGTSLGQLSKKMAEAARGGKAADLFDDIGIAVKDAEGRVRSTEEVLADISDVLASMPPGAQRTALAMKLLGKSGAEMMPMLEGGSEGLRTFAEEAAAMGLVISADTAAAAGKFNENIDRLHATARGLAVIVAARLAPVLKQFSDWLVDLSKAFQNLSPVTQKWMGLAAGFGVAIGPALIGLGAVVSSLGKVAMAFRGLALLVMGHPVIAAIAAIAAGAWLIYRNWEALTGWFSEKWGQVTTALTGAYTELQNFSLTLANEIKALPQTIADHFRSIISFFQNLSLKDAMTAALDMNPVKLGFDGIIWAASKFGFDLQGTIMKAFDDLGAWFAALPQRFMDYGTAIIQGLWDGIDAKWQEFKAAALAMTNDLPEWVRRALGINSPSRVFAEIGRNIMQGLGLGILQGQSSAVGAMDSALERLMQSGSVSGGAANAIDGATDAVQRLGEVSGSVFEGMGRWIAALIKGTTSLGEQLRRLAGQWANSLGQSVMTDIGTLLTGAFGRTGGGILAGLVGGLMGFAHGGSFAVGGYGGIDSQIVAFRASPNERVTVTTPEQSAAGMRYVEVPYMAVVDVDDGGRLVARIERMGEAAAAGGAAIARAQFPDVRRRTRDRF